MLDLILGMKRDLVSPSIDALHAECVSLIDALNRLDPPAATPPNVGQLRAIAERLIAVGEGLDGITATVLPTCDEVRIRDSGERLMRFSALLLELAPSPIPTDRNEST